MKTMCVVFLTLFSLSLPRVQYCMEKYRVYTYFQNSFPKCSTVAAAAASGCVKWFKKLND